MYDAKITDFRGMGHEGGGCMELILNRVHDGFVINNVEYQFVQAL